MTIIEEMEDNENSFVALWSDKTTLNCATLYANSVMKDDPFFNRVTDIQCGEFSSMLDSAEREFARRGLRPFVHRVSNAKLETELEERGYVLYDTMSVLLYEGIYRLGYSGDISVEGVRRENLRAWSDLFSTAFEVEDWKSEVERRIRASFDRLELYIAYVKGSPAGCAALFEKNSLLGLYCLGVLPEYRSRGVGTALISVSAEIARSKGTKLFLQTLLAEGLINYYLKRGFTQIYRKQIFYTIKASASSARQRR